MFSSTIIPTIGRPSLLRAVESVLQQAMPQGDFELIVVNDSGHALQPAAWQSSPRVRIIHTQQRERCFARNAGAAIARGRFLHFLDDDDWLLPGALASIYALWQAAPGASWLYGGIRIVDSHDHILAEINSAMHGSCAAQFVGGAWAPIQVSWIENQGFFAVGGFDQRMTPVIEDLDLCRRIALHGTFANTTGVLGCLRRDLEWGSTTAYQAGPSINREARDALLATPGTCRRLIASAGDCYWLGRVVHTYLSGLLLNARRRRLWTALSRLLHLLLTMLRALPCLWRRTFWRAATAEHVPDTLYYVLAELEGRRAA